MTRTASQPATLADQIREANAEASESPVEALAKVRDQMIASGAIQPVEAAPDPRQTGITHLRQSDPDCMKAWATKVPKGDTGEIILVYLDSGEKRLIHQRASGRFTIFAPIATE